MEPGPQKGQSTQSALPGNSAARVSKPFRLVMILFAISLLAIGVACWKYPVLSSRVASGLKTHIAGRISGNRMGTSGKTVGTPTGATPAQNVIELYRDESPNEKAALKFYTAEKFEPISGCYLGVYVLTAPNLDGKKDDKGQPLSRELAFGQVMGKKPASSFTYTGYGRPFPKEWASKLLAQGIAPHIAFEPNDGLDKVKDDAYLRQFAKDAQSCGGPIFLRFASEMNGDWTVYGQQPAKYREKFRLVHDVMAREAPNVAMMWCVFTNPQNNIPDFYPGDAYVDWVGVNIYNVYYHNNSRKHPGWAEHPSELLDFVYNTYSPRKPIVIAEFGVSHMDTLDRKDRSDFAASKILQLLTALPRKYPRVKMIDFFECDNIRYARAGRQCNDYAVTDNKKLISTVKKVLDTDYFLSEMLTKKQQQLPTRIVPVVNGATLRGTVRLSSWVKTNEFTPTVVYKVDNKELGRSCTQGDYGMDLRTNRFAAGAHTITVSLLSKSGKLLKKTSTRVVFKS